MRLLYQYVAHKLGKKKCQQILDSMKSGVAINLKQISMRQIDHVYKFMTTSRHVEKWLQRVDDQILLMKKKKVPVEISMIIGGYGSGKTHIKEYLTRKNINNVLFLGLNIDSLLETNQNNKSAINNIFSFILLNTKPYLDKLYDELVNVTRQSGKQLPRDIDDAIKEYLKNWEIDNQFIKAFCSYGGLGYDNRGDSKPLDDALIREGKNIFIPLMRLYKKHLQIKGVCIFVDEFEDLQHLRPDERALFIKSIRTFYDELADSINDPDSPSYRLLVLCTLSFWNEITTDNLSQALETRVNLFEIPPLAEDEILTIAEKLYALYVESGYLKSDVIFDSNKLQKYLLGIAKLESPLTPRFVIEQLINIIEYPEDYIKYLYQPQQ